MTAADVAFWFANHVKLWSPFAIGVLTVLMLGLIYLVVLGWEKPR